MHRCGVVTLSIMAKRIWAGIFPNIRAIAAEGTELNVVAVFDFAVFEDGDQLMAAAIQRDALV